MSGSTLSKCVVVVEATMRSHFQIASLNLRFCTITVQDGKIRRFRVEPLGENSGPPGFYTGVGGLIF